eukprot:m.118652 g.118652  ORF g.118652 m.118652 type:complete len:150 (-) comp16437_c0_seq1:125-574(-)
MTNPRQRKRRKAPTGRKPKKLAQHAPRGRVQRAITVTNPTIREKWDKTKTLNQNLQGLGLSADPNVTIKLPKPVEVDTSSPAPKQDLSALKQLEVQAASAESVAIHPAAGELGFLKRCVEKHGTDFDVSGTEAPHVVGRGWAAVYVAMM